MNALRVMVITTVPQTLAAFFPRQLRSLAETGFEVHAVSSPGPDLEQFQSIPGVTTHAVLMKRQPHPWHDSRSLLHLYRLIRRVRPQIVHAHTPKAGLLGMAAAKAAGVPVRLYTVHGLPLETRTGLWRRVLETAERTSAALSTQTYAISPSVQKRILEMNLCPASKLAVIGDGSCAGVDLQRFDAQTDCRALRAAFRQRLGLSGQALLLTFIGRLSRDKGVGVLAEAWAEIARQLPHAHLLLAGEADATDALPANLLDALRAHPRVHLPGTIVPEDVPTAYSASDIFVLPTFREGLSQVSLEAGAMGVPIVATQVTGMDAIEDGVTGLLVPPRDAASLAAAIVRLAHHPQLRDSLGAAAQKRVQLRYSAQRVNQLWMAEYRQLVSASLPGFEPAAAQIENRI